MEKNKDEVEKKELFNSHEEVKQLHIWQKMSLVQGLNIQINKDKAAHGYSYATLDQIMDKLNPIISKYGLLIFHQTDWDSEEKVSYLKTTVLNIDKPTETITSLTYLDSTVVLPGQNKVMIIGSQITYYRRYHVTSLFGLTTETDTDAGGAMPNKKGNNTGSVEAAGGSEKSVDFIAIFKNMISKGKDKAIVQKQFENYRAKMSEDQIVEVTALIGEIK